MMRCLDCYNLTGPYSKRKMNSMDGKRCDKCEGSLIPVLVGVDLALDIEQENGKSQ